MKTLILFYLIAAYSLFANAQWQQCPLHGGHVFSLTNNGTIIYAGVGNSLYKSSDSASTWTVSMSGSSFTYIHSIAVKGNAVYAGVYNNGMYRSDDSGATWIAINNGLPSYYTPYSILIKDSSIFIANPNSPNGGIYKSSDGGNSWISANNGIPDLSVYCLTSDSTAIYGGSIIGSGIFKSTDNGATWFSANTGLPAVSRVGTITVKGNEIFAGILSPGNGFQIYKTTDQAGNWSLCSGINAAIYKLAVCDDKLYLGTDNGVFYSADGNIWNPLNGGLTNFEITSFTVNGNDIFAGTLGGIFLLSQGNTSWTPVNNGITSFNVHSFSNINNNLFACTDAGVFLTSDAGITWAIKNNGAYALYAISSCASGTELYIGTHQDVYKTTNYGNSWVPLFVGMPGGTAPNTIVVKGSNVFLAAPNGIYKSEDSGQSWLLSNSGLTSTDIRDISISENGNIYAAVFNVGVFMSLNNGSNWANINGGFAGMNYINNIATNEDYLFAGLGLFNPPLVTSNDNGIVWKVGTNGLYGHEVKTLKTIGNSVFAGLNDGIFYTNNNGDVWLDVSSGLPLCEITSIGRDDSCIYVGTLGCGVWKRPLSDFVIDFTGNKTIDLSQTPKVFPNPFTSHLCASTNKDGYLTLLDYTGRPVLMQRMQSGDNTFNTIQLPPGLYFLKLQHGDKVYTYKVVRE